VSCSSPKQTQARMCPFTKSGSPPAGKKSSGERHGDASPKKRQAYPPSRAPPPPKKHTQQLPPPQRPPHAALLRQATIPRPSRDPPPVREIPLLRELRPRTAQEQIRTFNAADRNQQRSAFLPHRLTGRRSNLTDSVAGGPVAPLRPSPCDDGLRSAVGTLSDPARPARGTRWAKPRRPESVRSGHIGRG
jgi:hypothetical protein